MKKIFKLMMLALVGTFALASCEDVPIPYATPNLPNKDQQNANAIVATCAEAATLTNELADGATSSETYCVTGYITDVFATVSNNQQTFWMADTKDGGKVLQAYWANLPEGIDMFVVGTKVKITGKLLKYVKNDAVTPEIKNATVEILEDNGDEPGTPDFGEVEGDGKSIETAYNIAGANAICASLEKSVNAQSKYLSEEVYVKGIVSKIDNVDTGSYGNATYFISADGTEAGQFEIYRGYALGGEKFKSADEIKVGDNVVVCGNLVNWMGTYEFNQGSKIVKLNDKTASEEPNDPSNPGEPSGNATDISCAQAVALTNAMDENETTDETYAITGYITEVVGNVSRNQQTFWMADTKDGGNVFEAYYANLPAGLDKFVVGTKVKITGNILKYVNRDGDVTPEIKNADVEILEKAEGDNNQNENDPSGEQQPTGDGITVSNLPSDITVNAYGTQNVGSESTWITWTWNNVTFSGCRICKANAIDGTIQVQGNASDASKQGFIFNKTAWPSNIKKVTVVAKVKENASGTTYDPSYSLYAGTTAHPTTGAIEPTSTMSTENGVRTYVQVFNLSAAAAKYFTIANDKQGVLYIDKIAVE